MSKNMRSRINKGIIMAIKLITEKLERDRDREIAFMLWENIHITNDTFHKQTATTEEKKWNERKAKV